MESNEAAVADDIAVNDGDDGVGEANNEVVVSDDVVQVNDGVVVDDDVVEAVVNDEVKRTEVVEAVGLVYDRSK